MADAPTLDDRIRAALAKGPLDSYALAAILWPADSKAWRCSSNGGPPGWVLPLGKAIKRLKLVVSYAGKKKIIQLPRTEQ